MQQKAKMMINLNKNKKLRPLLILLYISTGKGVLYIIVKIQIFKLLVQLAFQDRRGRQQSKNQQKNISSSHAKRTHQVPSRIFFSSKNTTKYHNHQEQNLYIQTHYTEILEHQQIKENPKNCQRGHLKEGVEDWYQISHQQH